MLDFESLLQESAKMHGHPCPGQVLGVRMSIKKAWSYIKAMEERLGIRLVKCQTGGKSGGGARLTDEAREFLKRYQTPEEGINDYVDERFKRTFESGS